MFLKDRKHSRLGSTRSDRSLGKALWWNAENPLWMDGPGSEGRHSEEEEKYCDYASILKVLNYVSGSLLYRSEQSVTVSVV
jgi:hypothetical protein